MRATALDLGGSGEPLRQAMSRRKGAGGRNKPNMIQKLKVTGTCVNPNTLPERAPDL
jgi:hypothetical protein